GFRTSRSVVLHRFGTKRDYDDWKSDLFANSVQNGRAVPPTGIESLDSDVEGIFPPAQLSTQTRSVARNRVKQKTLSPADRDRQAALNTGVTRFNQSTQVGNFGIVTSRRNTTALFGVGLIDSIPDQAIEAAAAAKHNDFPGVHGRVVRLADGKIGRFGWKSQKATLREFAMTACAVELGLNVPEQQQAGLAYDPDYKAPGLDMDLKECDALVTFLRKLPTPAELKPATATETKYIHGGRDLFAKVGCAACHTPELGKVAGIYSDLLVHDMGPELGDTGSYGVFVPSNSTDDISETLAELTAEANTGEIVPPGKNPPQAKPAKKVVGATRQEWRTAPLWGVRDSAPYLHDGRADTLDQAIAMHGGEADPSVKRFFALTREERMQTIAFLKSLVAPEQVAAR
ncbi:MAG: hypothetical protein K8T91_14060, partial [Planctomycetes bacterium]|nr:hypothetical protein [Planctomycetota bacterium]